MLDLSTARRLAKEIRDENPDFVYNLNSGDCFYVPLPVVLGWIETEPESTRDEFLQYQDLRTARADDPRQQVGCYVGQILDRAGVTEHRSKAYRDSDVVDLERAGLVDKDASNYLLTLQTQQDTGRSFDRAYSLAEHRLVDPFAMDPEDLSDEDEY